LAGNITEARSLNPLPDYGVPHLPQGNNSGIIKKLADEDPAGGYFPLIEMLALGRRGFGNGAMGTIEEPGRHCQNVTIRFLDVRKDLFVGAIDLFEALRQNRFRHTRVIRPIRVRDHDQLAVRRLHPGRSQVVEKLRCNVRFRAKKNPARLEELLFRKDDPGISAVCIRVRSPFTYLVTANYCASLIGQGHNIFFLFGQRLPVLFLNIVDHQEVFTYTGREQELVNPRELILWDIGICLCRHEKLHLGLQECAPLSKPFPIAGLPPIT
jgi:hypothetical protein